jgi:hypothetical protein
MNEYMNESEEDLFELKYMEDIAHLFGKLKKMDDHLGTDLLSSNYCPFFDFIKDHVVIHEFPEEVICEEYDNIMLT